MQRTFTTRMASRLSLGAMAALRVRATTALPSSTSSLSSTMCAPKRFAHDAALADATRRELDEELARNDRPEQPTAPAGWQVQHQPGTCTIDVTKTYEGEQITARFSSNPSADKNSVDFLVYVSQPGKETMQVDMSIEEGELVLNRVRFFTDDKLARDTSATAVAKKGDLYEGPLVHELDYDLLGCVMGYLEKRGVDEKMSEFIILYCFWTEQQQYEGWLSSLNKIAS